MVSLKGRNANKRRSRFFFFLFFTIYMNMYWFSLIPCMYSIECRASTANVLDKGSRHTRDMNCQINLTDDLFNKKVRLLDSTQP